MKKKFKFKTLNDLQEIRINDTKGVLMVEDPLVFKQDLKQQAIKWVKAKIKPYDFQDFFNITEEDLEEYLK